MMVAGCLDANGRSVGRSPAARSIYVPVDWNGLKVSKIAAVVDKLDAFKADGTCCLSDNKWPTQACTNMVVVDSQ